MMGTSTLLISVLVAAMSLQQTLSFRSSTSTVRSRMSSGSSSSRKFLSPAATDLGQFLSTSIATAAAEVASNPIVAKQIFEPQISTETGIGISCNCFWIRAFLDREEDRPSSHLRS